MTAREPAGYFFDAQVPELASLVGRDVSRFTLSWTRGAGGIVSTTHDMTVWERAMYGGALLPARQQAELMSLVSEKTGQPIEQTSQDDPRGFGLGVEQLTGPDPRHRLALRRRHGRFPHRPRVRSGIGSHPGYRPQQ